MEDRMISDTEMQRYLQRGRRLRAQMFARVLGAAADGLAHPFKAWLLHRKFNPGNLAIGEGRKLAGCLGR